MKKYPPSNDEAASMTPDPNARPAAVDALREAYEPIFRVLYELANTPAINFESDREKAAWAHRKAYDIYGDAQRFRAALAAPIGPAAVDALRKLADSMVTASCGDDPDYAEWGPVLGRDMLRFVNQLRDIARELPAALAAHHGPPAVDEAKLRETLAWANDEIDVYTDAAEPGDETIESEHPYLIHLMRIRRVLTAALAKPAQEAAPRGGGEACGDVDCAALYRHPVTKEPYRCECAPAERVSDTVMVPREPGEAFFAAMDCGPGYEQSASRAMWRKAYAAMIAAAPPAAQASDDQFGPVTEAELDAAREPITPGMRRFIRAAQASNS